MNKRRAILFVLLGAAGFFYRIYFSSLAYREILWDVQSYGNIAKGMMNNPMFVDCCQKSPGYPAFLAVVYTIFGTDNLAAVSMTQIVLDLVSAVLLYSIARRYFSNNAALLVFALYLFHPLAASYVGFQLPETVTILLLVLSLWIFSHRRFLVEPGLWLLFGAILGIILWVRLSYYYFVFLALGGIALLLFRANRRAIFTLVAGIGFITVSLHSIASYQVAFGRFSLIPPYSMGMPAALYMSYFMDRYPELISQYQSLDRGYYDINLEYNTTHYLQNVTFRAKYHRLFFEKFKTDWPQFAGNTLRNAVWMWDVNHLFVYADPWYPLDRLPLRIVNVTGLLLCVSGIVRYAKRNGKKWIRDPILLFTVLVMGYVTVLFAPITNETRYVVPLYPFVLLWAGYALYDHNPFFRS